MGDAEGASVLGMAVLGLFVGLEEEVVETMLSLGLFVGLEGEVVEPMLSLGLIV